MTGQLVLQTIKGIPLIKSGDDLAAIILDCLEKSGTTLMQGDILVLAQKIVSKATGCYIDLRDMKPGRKALELAKQTGKDPRLVQAILSESSSVVRHRPGVLVTEHRLGWIMANAGLDASNVGAEGGDEIMLRLPDDPDGFCETMRQRLLGHCEVSVGVLINDSFGRPFRLGTTGVALGAAGLPSLWDRRGETDLFGRELMVSQQAVADELASAASLLQGQAAEGSPVVLVRGYQPFGTTPPPHVAASALIRSRDEDMFR